MPHDESVELGVDFDYFLQGSPQFASLKLERYFNLYAFSRRDPNWDLLKHAGDALGTNSLTSAVERVTNLLHQMLCPVNECRYQYWVIVTKRVL